MVDFGTSDKLLLLSNIEVDENSEEEDELFDKTSENSRIRRNQLANRRELSRSRTSTKTNLFDDTYQSQRAADSTVFTMEQNSEEKPSQPLDTNCWYRLSLLMINYLLNGISFGLFIYSRRYFMDLFQLSDATTINAILLYLSSVLMGVFLVNFMIKKLDRFHFLFVCSMLNSISLFCMVQTHNFTNILIFMSIFGVCMGLSNTIAFKWCLSLNYPRRAQNWQTNLLQLMAIAGLIIFSCLLSSGVQDSRYNSNLTNQSISDQHTVVITTTPKIHLKKPEISDGSFLEQNHVTKPTLLTTKLRKKRQFIADMPITNEAIETTVLVENIVESGNTTTKVHRKKPEAADGSFLEQSHVTKPNIAPLSTSTKTIYDNDLIDKSISLRSCLKNIQRKCQFNLNNCQIATNQTNTFSCEYVYETPGSEVLSANQQICEDLKKTQLDKNQTVNGMQNCFTEIRTKLDGLIQFNKEMEYECYLQEEVTRTCQAKQSCHYVSDVTLDDQMTKEVTDCFQIELQRSETTTTSTTPATTTEISTATIALVTSTTTTTTEIPTTSITILSIISNTSLPNLTDTGVLVFANNLFSTSKQTFSSIMLISNDLERLYLIMSLCYLCLAFLHCLFLLKFLNKILFNLFAVIFRCKRYRPNTKSNVSYHRANSGDTNPSDIPLLSLKSPFAVGNTEVQSNLSIGEAIKTLGLWLILGLFFFNGGLFLNMMLFMQIYLTSQLTAPDSSSQSESVFKMFVVSFILGRSVTMLLRKLNAAIEAKKGHKSPVQVTHGSFLIFAICNWRLFINFLLLVLVSAVQLVGNTHTALLESAMKRNNSQSISLDLAPDAMQIPQGLSKLTLFSYGIIYPLLQSTITPQILSLYQNFLQQISGFQEVNSSVTLYVWQIGLLGSILIALINNYVTFNIFHTANSFVYLNFLQCVSMLLLLCLFSYVSNRKVAKSPRFISFNDLQMNETENQRKAAEDENKRHRFDNDMNDLSNLEDDEEEIVLMIENNLNNKNVVQSYND